MTQTQVDIDAAEAVVEAMAEIGVPGTVTPRTGGFDPTDGSANKQPQTPVHFTMSPPLLVNINLVGSSAPGGDEGNQTVVDTDFIVLISGADVRASELEEIALYSTIAIGTFSGMVVKTMPVHSGTLITAWKVVLRG